MTIFRFEPVFESYLLVAAIAATLIPIALRAMKIDPALASAVFITTLTDVFGSFAVLGLATILDNAISSSTTDAFFARKSGSFATGMPVMLVSACPWFMLVTAASVGVPAEPGARQ